MAELIGLIASIGTIASAGFAIAKTISTLADDLGSAAHHARAISTDTKAVAMVLHELKRRLDRPSSITRQTFDIANEIADLCKADIDQIKEFLLPMLPAGGRNMSVSQKAKWRFFKSKIEMRRSSLDSLKLTVTLFLHTLDFIEGDLIDEEYMRDEIEAMVAKSKNTKSAFLAAERIDQMSERVYNEDPSSSDITSATDDTMNTVDVSVQLLDYSHQLREEGTLVLKGGNDREGDRSAMKLLHSAMASQLDSPSSDFQMIENMSDDHFIQIAHHIRTQKRVTSYALVVLDGRQEKDGVNRHVPANEAEEQSNQSQEPSTNSPQGINLHRRENIRTEDETSVTGTVDEWPLQRDKSRTGFGDARVGSASTIATDGGSETHVDIRSNSYQGMRDNRGLSDHRQTRAGIDTRETSDRHPTPENLNRPKSQLNSPSYFEAWQHRSNGNGPPPIPSDGANYTVPSLAQPQGYGINDAYFAPPQQQTPYQPYHPYLPWAHTPDITREDPEKAAMKQQIAEMTREQRRKEEEAKQKELERRIRQEAEEAFARKMEQLKREEELKADERRHALAKVKQELDVAKKEADKAAREAIEAEWKAAAERERRAAEIFARAKQEGEQQAKLEAEQRAEAERRKGLRGVFSRFK
ncbi:hypothetical protein F5Y10DRAFT_284827 [Nemania abortiva]|nr:hypothetical protein F5Y10DRAFT_284827 [Nemania abortiva]